MLTALLASENIATLEVRHGYRILPYASSDIMKSVFAISFFLLQFKMCTMKVFRIFSFKNEFLLEPLVIA